MKNKFKSTIYKIIVMAILLLLSFNVTKIIKWKKESIETNKIITQIKLPTINKKNESINIISKQEKNKDIIGYLKVNNTNINYPFVKGKDNNYYLNHDINKKKTTSGWIFLDYRNNSNLKNKNSIIYGHARKDKTMFGTLKNTLKKEWYKDKSNHIITITNDTKVYKYKIFSIYTIKKENYYLQTYFKTEKDYKDFIETIHKRSIYNFKTSIKDTNYIITLSTCYKDNKRIVLHAKLIN